MTTRGTLRGRWVREVYRTPLITDSVRVLLVALSEDMAENGYVSVPRAVLAGRLGKSPRRVQERFDSAVRAGLLDRVRAGKPGVTAEYVAMMPNANAKPVRSASSKPLARLVDGAHDRPTTTTEHGAHDRPTDMGRIAAPIGERTTAPSPHAQHGAHDRPASSKHAGTAAGRAAWEPGTTETRNDSGSDQPARPLRAVAVDGAA